MLKKIFRIVVIVILCCLLFYQVYYNKNLKSYNKELNDKLKEYKTLTSNIEKYDKMIINFNLVNDDNINLNNELNKVKEEKESIVCSNSDYNNKISEMNKKIKKIS